MLIIHYKDNGYKLKLNKIESELELNENCDLGKIKEIFLSEMEKIFDWAAAELVEDGYVEV